MRYLLAALLVSCTTAAPLPDETMTRCDCPGGIDTECSTCVESGCEPWCTGGGRARLVEVTDDGGGWPLGVTLRCGDRAPAESETVACYR